MKIAYLLDDTLDKPDGVQQYVLALGAWMTSQGHDVHYIVGNTQRADIPNIHSLGKNIKVRFNGNTLTIPFYVPKRHIRQLLSAHTFDVMHVQSPHHPLLSQRVILNAPHTTAVVGTFHIMPNDRIAAWLTRLLGVWLRGSLRRMYTMLAVSSAARTFVESSFRVPAQVMPNTIDLQPFLQAPADHDHQLKVVYLNRLVARKGVLQLIAAVDYLINQLGYAKSFKVLIGGKGELTDQAAADIRRFGLEDVIQLLGFVPESDKGVVLAGADVVAYPSTGGESFGIVLLEGMAAARGVVLAGNNPGYATVMAPFPEQLFDPIDIPAFASTLRRYLDDSTLRRQAAKQQRVYAQTFDIRAVGPRLESMYQQAITSAKR